MALNNVKAIPMITGVAPRLLKIIGYNGMNRPQLKLKHKAVKYTSTKTLNITTS